MVNFYVFTNAMLTKVKTSLRSETLSESHIFEYPPSSTPFRGFLLAHLMVERGSMAFAGRNVRGGGGIKLTNENNTKLTNEN